MALPRITLPTGQSGRECFENMKILDCAARLSSLFIAASSCEARSVDDFGKPCISPVVTEFTGDGIRFDRGSPDGNYNAGERARDFHLYVTNICRLPVQETIISTNCHYDQQYPSSVRDLTVAKKSNSNSGYSNSTPTCSADAHEVDRGPADKRCFQTNSQIDETNKGAPRAMPPVTPPGELKPTLIPSHKTQIAACIRKDLSNLGIPFTCDLKLTRDALELCEEQGLDLARWCTARVNRSSNQNEFFDRMTKRKRRMNALPAPKSAFK